MILLISGLDISDDDIRAVDLVYNEVRKEDKYKIVWIPVIPEYFREEEARKIYEYLSSLMKWYIVPYTRKIAGWRYLEENWQFRQDPLVVVMNSKSKVEFANAIHLIRVWGAEAIPFTKDRTLALLKKNWPESGWISIIGEENPFVFGERKSLTGSCWEKIKRLKQLERMAEILTPFQIRLSNLLNRFKYNLSSK